MKVCKWCWKVFQGENGAIFCEKCLAGFVKRHEKDYPRVAKSLSRAQRRLLEADLIEFYREAK